MNRIRRATELFTNLVHPRFPYALSEIRAYYECKADIRTMTTREGALELARIIQEESVITVVKSDVVFIDADDPRCGYTLNCTLAASGVSFDCWPEEGTVIQYLDLCNVNCDNSAKMDALWPPVARYFQAQFMVVYPRITIPINAGDASVTRRIRAYARRALERVQFALKTGIIFPLISL